jgi:hypothetical protein
MWDRTSGTRGTFTGVVRFSELHLTELNGTGDDCVLLFREEGTLHWTDSGGKPFTGPASREYLLRPSDAPDAMEVFFPDGRPFHRMSFTAADTELHWCDPDTYRVQYNRVGQDEFRYTWDVTGPAKDLLLESVLRRLAEQPLGSES